MPHDVLEKIQQKPISDEDKLSAVINIWKKSQSPPFTWETVITVLESHNNEDLIRKLNEIHDYLSERNNYLIFNPQVNDTVIVFSNILFVYIMNISLKLIKIFQFLEVLIIP